LVGILRSSRCAALAFGYFWTLIRECNWRKKRPFSNVPTHRESIFVALTQSSLFLGILGRCRWMLYRFFSFSSIAEFKLLFKDQLLLSFLSPVYWKVINSDSHRNYLERDYEKSLGAKLWSTFLTAQLTSTYWEEERGGGEE
jgi:hypothetical protein